MGSNPFVGSGNTGALEKIKSQLRAKAGESAREAATQLLSTDHLSQVAWADERLFWRRQILPLWRSTTGEA